MESAVNHLTQLLAQSNSGGAAAAGAGAAIVLVFYLAIIILFIAGMWKVFSKAGQPGFLAIIPIVNIFFLTKIVGRPAWFIILFFVPIVSLVASIIVMSDLSKSFGRGIGTTLGLIFLGPIFFCILGFGSAEYQGPAAG